MEEIEDLGMHAEPPEFVALVGELEAAAGKRLRNPGRERCLRAFGESPDGFARTALSAKRRARTSPLGLLCKMVEDGEHVLPGTMRGAGACFVCNRHSRDALRRGGQWWCSEHEEEAA